MPRKNKLDWVDTSPRVGEDYLKDEEYEAYNLLTKPLLAHIVSRFKNDTHDSMDEMEKFLRNYEGEFLFLGDTTIPLAIEVSQWGYETLLMLQEKVENLDRTLDRQGAIIKEVIIDDLDDVPEARCIVHMNLLDKVSDDAIRYWFPRILRRCDVMIFGVDNTRDWKTYLAEYQIEYIYENGTQSYFAVDTKRHNKSDRHRGARANERRYRPNR